MRGIPWDRKCRETDCSRAGGPSLNVSPQRQLWVVWMNSSSGGAAQFVGINEIADPKSAAPTALKSFLLPTHSCRRGLTFSNRRYAPLIGNRAITSKRVQRTGTQRRAFAFKSKIHVLSKEERKSKIELIRVWSCHVVESCSSGLEQCNRVLDV